MTLVFKKETPAGELVVEYVISSVTKGVKVVDMTLDGQFHRLNWMTNQGSLELMDDLENHYRDTMDEAAWLESKAELHYGI
jgi:hypothetical protein|tara:strand:+ start:723 stop:965 length:243 start_codon:yes stop_codon:yes gene_type:complete